MTEPMADPTITERLRYGIIILDRKPGEWYGAVVVLRDAIAEIERLRTVMRDHIKRIDMIMGNGVSRQRGEEIAYALCDLGNAITPDEAD